MARDNGTLRGSLCSSHKQPSQPQKMKQPFNAAPRLYTAAGRDITWLASVKRPRDSKCILEHVLFPHIETDPQWHHHEHLERRNKKMSCHTKKTAEFNGTKKTPFKH